MTKPTQETLREAVARAIGAANLNCDPAGIDPDEWQNEADAAIATMFERLRTPSEGVVRRLNAACDTPDADLAWVFPVIATAFQQENSDAD